MPSTHQVPYKYLLNKFLGSDAWCPKGSLVCQSCHICHSLLRLPLATLGPPKFWILPEPMFCHYCGHIGGGKLPQYLPASSFLITCWGWGLYQGSRPVAEGIGDRLRIFGLPVQNCCEGKETCVRSWCFESLWSIHMSLCTKSYTRPLVILSHNVSHRTQAISGVSSCSKVIVLPLLLWFFGCLSPSPAWGPWVVHAPDGDRDFGDIAMR